jgi:two-component system nitrogen regulation response regulator GlnG
LTSACLPSNVRQQPEAASPTTAGSASGPVDLVEWVRGLLRSGESEIYAKVYALVDRVVLTEVLEHTGGNQVQAKKLLGISRTTLRTKLQEQGLTQGTSPVQNLDK